MKKADRIIAGLKRLKSLGRNFDRSVKKADRIIAGLKQDLALASGTTHFGVKKADRIIAGLKQ